MFARKGQIVLLSTILTLLAIGDSILIFLLLYAFLLSSILWKVIFAATLTMLLYQLISTGKETIAHIRTIYKEREDVETLV